MIRRVVLFVAVNLAVTLTLSTLVTLLGIGPVLRRSGLDVGSLMALCLVWGMGGALISLLISRWVAKAAMGVRRVQAPGATAAEARLLATVARLAERAGLPAMPEVGIYDAAEINAFATGPTRARSLVAVSSGLLRQLDDRAVEGVLGHEIAHVANGDMVTMTLLQGVVNAFAMFLARAIAYAVGQGARRDDDDGRSRGGSPWLAVMVQMALEMVFMLAGSLVVAAFSRWREFRADRGGAELAGRGAMVAALQALASAHGGADLEAAEAQPAAGAVATLMIDGRARGMAALFASHPPLAERIARLRAG